jgi:hypothetical protein
MNNRYARLPNDAVYPFRLNLLQRLRSYFKIKKLFIKLIRNFVLLMVIGVFVYFATIASTSIFQFGTSNAEMFNSTDTYVFTVDRKCRIVFRTGSEYKLEIDRTHGITRNDTYLNIYIGRGYLPFESCLV